MAARSGGKFGKTTNVLNRTIHPNPKYGHIKSQLDTGSSLSRHAQRIEEIRKNYRYRKDEIFKRMKVSTFCQLVLQVAEVIGVEADRELLTTADTSVSSNTYQEEEDVPQTVRSSASPPGTSRSTLQSLIHGVGEVDVGDTSLAPANPPDVPTLNLEDNDPTPPDPMSLPYLLLDIRDQDAFRQCHIIGAINYPVAMLSRSINYFIKEILEFKNRTGKIIILYDEEERIAPGAATVFVQRDVDNVFLLSGGMKVLNRKFPGCFFTGVVPENCVPSPPQTSRKGKQRPKQKTIPQQIEQRHLQWFTPTHLQKMEDCLEVVLLSNDSSRMSSRSSVASTSSRQSTQSSRSVSSTKPWK